MRNPFRELLRLPVVVWLYGLDGSQRLLQRASALDDDSAALDSPPPPARPDPAVDLALGGDGLVDGAEAAHDRGHRGSDDSRGPGAPRGSANSFENSHSQHQEKTMDDRNLSDDMVKLVTYDIVSIAREAERILCSGSIMVTDNTSGEAFASWMIARHLQGDAAAESRVSDAERKYLRVCYRVKERWPKQSLYYEERQLATLEGIQAAIRQATFAQSGSSTALASPSSSQATSSRASSSQAGSAPANPPAGSSGSGSDRS